MTARCARAPGSVVLVDSSGFNIPFARRAPARLPDALLRVAAGLGVAHRPDPQARALGESARGDLPVRAGGVCGHARARGVRRTSAGRAARARLGERRPRERAARAAPARERADRGAPARQPRQRDAPPAAAPARGGARAARARSAHPLRDAARRVARTRGARSGDPRRAAAVAAADRHLDGQSLVALRAATWRCSSPASTLEAARRLSDRGRGAASRFTAGCCAGSLRAALTMPNLIAGERSCPVPATGRSAG